MSYRAFVYPNAFVSPPDDDPTKVQINYEISLYGDTPGLSTLGGSVVVSANVNASQAEHLTIAAALAKVADVYSVTVAEHDVIVSSLR